MDTRKPTNINEYKNWLRTKHGIQISSITKNYYDISASRVKQQFEGSDLWIQLNENLKEYDDTYLINTGYPLLIGGTQPSLLIKPFDSFILKTFRMNILENEYWPNKPENGWVLPDNWYSKVNDIVRTLIVVKYLDGVEFMIGKIQCLCEQQRLAWHVDFEAKEEGYYAAHLYVIQEFEIPRLTWDTRKTEFSIEIQITTQLQEVIRKLLHKYYEKRRKKAEEGTTRWQWDYRSDEFATNYLGHMLHYIEGMIMEIREKQKEEIVWKRSSRNI